MFVSISCLLLVGFCLFFEGLIVFGRFLVVFVVLGYFGSVSRRLLSFHAAQQHGSQIRPTQGQRGLTKPTNSHAEK